MDFGPFFFFFFFLVQRYLSGRWCFPLVFSSVDFFLESFHSCPCHAIVLQGTFHFIHHISKCQNGCTLIIIYTLILCVIKEFVVPLLGRHNGSFPSKQIALLPENALCANMNVIAGCCRTIRPQFLLYFSNSAVI